MTLEEKRCLICRRLLDQPDDETTLDCGGDCLRCMAEIGEDPDCIKALPEIEARRRKDVP